MLIVDEEYLDALRGVVTAALTVDIDLHIGMVLDNRSSSVVALRDALSNVPARRIPPRSVESMRDELGELRRELAKYKNEVRVVNKALAAAQKVIAEKTMRLQEAASGELAVDYLKGVIEEKDRLLATRDSTEWKTFAGEMERRAIAAEAKLAQIRGLT